MPRTDPPWLRRKVLDAALSLVDSGGIDALSIRGGRAARERPHRAPYHPSTIEMRSSLRSRTKLRPAPRAADRRVRARAAGRRSVHGVRLGYFRFAVEHRAHFRIMFRPESHAAKRAEIRRAATEATQVLVECVVAAQAAGLAPPGDPMPLVVMSWSTAHGVSALWVDGALNRGLGVFGRDAGAVAGLIARTLTSVLKAAAKKPRR